MNRSTKSLLALVILMCLGASVLGWTTPGIEGVSDLRFLMRASGIIILPAIALLVWGNVRRHRVPDVLRKRATKYFDRDGFCFAIHSTVKDDCFAWQVLFQNRYERPCKASLTFRPARRSVGFARAELDEVRIEIDCEGGGFGSAIVPYGIPLKYQGKKKQFEVIATSKFPAGKGKMLRYRNGARVGKHPQSAVDVSAAAVSLLTLHPNSTHPATFKLRLPEKVSIEAVGKTSQRVLWRLGNQIS